MDRSNAATRPAVMRCHDPLVTVSHAQASWGLAFQLKIISVKQACSCMHGVPNARPQVPVATLRSSKWPSLLVLLASPGHAA